MALDEEQIFRLVLDAQRAVNADTREDSVRSAIHSAVGQILREGKFQGEVYTPPVINTVPGTHTYTLHADLAVVLSVRITEGADTRMLDFLDADEIDKHRYAGTPVPNNKPEVWGVEGTDLILFPTPDAVYRLTVKAEKKLHDVAAIPDQFLDVVLYGAQSVFNPQFLGIFQKGKAEVKQYFQMERDKVIQFEKDPMVEAHELWQHRNNVY